VDNSTKNMLRAYAARYETRDFINGDPSWFMHQVKGSDNQEWMAFLASGLSYGRREQFMQKISILLHSCEGDICGWLRDKGYESLFEKDDRRCFYRLHTRGDLYSLCDACRHVQNEYGTLGAMLRTQGINTALGAIQYICSVFSTLGSGGIVPKDATSSCKRLAMFLRWMVRQQSPVDLGLWTFISPATLVMPLDTHVLRMSRHLGLLSSGTASMSSAIRLTAALSEVFEGDPVKGDYALFGYGVNHREPEGEATVRE
jgi:uncharacterized protein (TIGR02757 family)